MILHTIYESHSSLTTASLLWLDAGRGHSISLVGNFQAFTKSGCLLGLVLLLCYCCHHNKPRFND